MDRRHRYTSSVGSPETLVSNSGDMIGTTSTFQEPVYDPSRSYTLNSYNPAPQDAYTNTYNSGGQQFSSPPSHHAEYGSPYNNINGGFNGGAEVQGHGGGAGIDHFNSMLRHQQSLPDSGQVNQHSGWNEPSYTAPGVHNLNSSPGTFAPPDGSHFQFPNRHDSFSFAPPQQPPPQPSHSQSNAYGSYSSNPGGFADYVLEPRPQPRPLYHQASEPGPPSNIDSYFYPGSGLLGSSPTSMPPLNADGSRKIIGSARSHRSNGSSKGGAGPQAGSAPASYANRNVASSAEPQAPPYSVKALTAGLPQGSSSHSSPGAPTNSRSNIITPPTARPGQHSPTFNTFHQANPNPPVAPATAPVTHQKKRPRPNGATHKPSQSLTVPQRASNSRSPQYVEYDYDDYDDSDSDGEPEGGAAAKKKAGGAGGKKGVTIKEDGTGAGAPEGLKRLPGACSNCKRLKMKCLFESEWDIICKRCRDTGKKCVCEGRKRRERSNKREQLMTLLREKDKIIDTLLRQIHNPSNQTPLTFMPEKLSPGLQPSANSAANGDSSSNPGKAVPISSSSNFKDIQAWLASSGTNHAVYRSPYERTFMDDDYDSSDEEIEDRDNEVDKSSDFPESLMDSVSQRGRRVRGGSHNDRLEVASAASSSGLLGKKGHGRRASSSDPKLHSLPDERTPLGLFANLSLTQTEAEREAELAKQRRRLSSLSNSSLGSAMSGKAGGLAASGSKSAGASTGAVNSSEMEPPTPDGGPDDDVGPANKNYWKPGPSANPDLRRIIIERQMPPEILTSGLVNPEDVEALFKIFYDRLNVFLSILDPKIHTPANIYGRCPFLFTVICAISSRYYTEKPHLYSIAMHFAKVAASTSLIDGWKSVELCQAYILLSVYPVHARRWEEDRTWLYLGLAIRMATDLNLHQPSATTKFVNEAHEREILNRTRTWLICYNLDRSCATQFGKPTTIKEDAITRNASLWWKKSQYNHPFDIHLCAYTQLLRIVQGFMEEVYSDTTSSTGLNKNADFEAITLKYNEQISAFKEETAARFRVESDPKDPACAYRTELLPFLVQYSRLVMFSFGFQNAFQKGQLTRGNTFLVHCLNAASSVVKIVIEVLAPSGYLRYAADGHFVFAAFASAFLLKLLRPQFCSLLDPDQQNRIVSLINRLIKTLASNEVAVDDRHTPKLYSRFLEGLLMKRNQMVKEEAEKQAAEARTMEPPQPPLKASNGPPATITIQIPQFPTSGVANGEAPSQERLMSPTIEVHAPEESGIVGPALTYNPNQSQPQMHPDYFGSHDNSMFLESGYDHSVAASSTIDAPTTHFTNEDILMQGDDGWIATMGALDNPAFWSHGMLPGFSWPSPEMGWPAPIASGSDAGSSIVGAVPPQQPQPKYQPYSSDMNGLLQH